MQKDEWSKDQFFQYAESLAMEAKRGNSAAYNELVERFEAALVACVTKEFRKPEITWEDAQEVFRRVRRIKQQQFDPEHFLTWVWGLIGLSSGQPGAFQIREGAQILNTVVPGPHRFLSYHDAFSDFRERVRQCNFNGEEIKVQWIGLAMEHGANDIPVLFEHSSVRVTIEMVMLHPEWPELAKLDPNWPDLTRTNCNRVRSFLARVSRGSACVSGKLFGYREPPHINGFAINRRWHYVTWADRVDDEIRTVGPEGYFFVEPGDSEQADTIIADFGKWFDRFRDQPLFPGGAEVGSADITRAEMSALAEPVEADSPLSARDLLKKWGLPESFLDRLENRLARHRMLDRNCFAEVQNRSRRRPQYLYYPSHVRNVLESLKARISLESPSTR